MRYNWNRLDNAAKIFPSAVTGTDTQVFRFSCELFEPVKPDILQEALLDTVEEFPLYRYTLKRGFFWYYLDKCDLKPHVREEYKSPCSGIYDKNRKTLLYEVTYYRNRINLEVFHVLSDGAGVMNFLKALAAKYISRLHKLEEPVLDYDASFTEKEDDSFARHYAPEKGHETQKQGRACQIRGPKLPDNRMRVIQGVMPVREVLDAAHSYNATLTAFLAACLMTALREDMTRRDLRRPVSLVVPVNLRQFFKSESARNFFSLIFLNYDFLREKDDFDSVIKKLDEQLKKKLTQENMEQRLNSLFSLEKNIFARLVPLIIKDIGLRTAYRYSEFESTASLSNIGVVRMPKELEGMVKAFHVSCATSKMQACVCSYGENLSITFTSPVISTDIERRFFRKISELGIGIVISANDVDER